MGPRHGGDSGSWLGSWGYRDGSGVICRRDSDQGRGGCGDGLEVGEELEVTAVVVVDPGAALPLRGLVGVCFGAAGFIPGPLAHEDFFEVELPGAGSAFIPGGLRGEGAEGGVLDDFLDGGLGLGGLGDGGEFGEGDGGDLESVEQESGAAGIDLVGGDAAEDLGDGELDGAAVLDEGELEGGAAVAAFEAGFPFGVPNWDTRGVVEVTKFFVAEADAAAALSGGVDVAALELGWLGFRIVHGVSPYPGLLCAKY
jgi:hypothetical protein